MDDAKAKAAVDELLSEAGRVLQEALKRKVVEALIDLSVLALAADLDMTSEKFGELARTAFYGAIERPLQRAGAKEGREG